MHVQFLTYWFSLFSLLVPPSPHSTPYPLAPRSSRQKSRSIVASESFRLEIGTTYICLDQQCVGSRQRNMTAFLKAIFNIKDKKLITEPYARTWQRIAM